MQIFTNATIQLSALNETPENSLVTSLIKRRSAMHRFMRAVVSLAILMSIFISANVQAQYSNVPVTGFNADIVADGTTNVDATATTTIGADAGGYVFVTNTFRPSAVGTACNTANALPSSLTSTNATNATGITYALAPATSNNDLRLNAGGTATLTLSSPITGTSNIYVLGLGGEGATNFNATVNFSGGTTETISSTLPDWCGGAATYKVTTTQYYRITRTSTTCGGGLCQYIYEVPLAISPSNYFKTINSITFNNTSTGTLVVNVLGIGSKAACAAPANGPTGLTQGTTNTSSIQASFTAAASLPSGYLSVAYPTGAIPVNPVDGTAYTTGQLIGTGKILQSSAATTITASGLTGGTAYDIYVYSYNTGATCGGPVYNIAPANVLFGTFSTTACGGLAGGTYSVGPTAPGSPAGFTNLTSALAYITANGVSGPVILELQAAYSSATAGETYPIAFSANSCIGAINSVTIRPETGATGLFITSVNATGTINFNGANYITIDGRPGGVGVTSQLTIANTNAGISYAINYTGDASNNTVKYCTIASRNTSATSGTIVFGSGTTTGNDNNTIDNCTIADGTSTPLNGIYSAGTSTTVDNSGNIVSNCNIANYFGVATAANGIFLASNSSAWTITGNRFYQTASRTPTTGTQNRAIQIVTATGGNYTINNNIIGYASNTSTGITTYAGNFTSRFVGIEITSSNSLVSSIQGNTVTNVSVTTSSAGSAAAPVFGGIVILGGAHNVGTVTGNTIGAATGTGAIVVSGSTTSFYVDGIYATSTGNVNIKNTNIGSINAAGNAAAIGCQFYGIWCLGTAGNFTVTSNVVGSTSTASSIVIGIDLTTTATSSNQNFYGIRCDNTGNTVVGGSGLGNTIQNIALRTNSSAAFYGYYNGAISTAPSYTYNTLNGIAQGWTTTAGSGTFYGFYNISTLTTLLTVSNNSFQNITNLNTSGTIYLAYNSNSTPNVNFQNNIFNNITRASGLSATLYVHYNGSSPTGTQNFTGNTMTNLTASATSGSGTFYGLYNLTSSSSTWNVSGNTVSAITAGSGGGYGLYIGYGNVTCFNNTVNNFTSSGSMYGIYLGGSVTTGGALYSNTVYTLSSSGASSTIYGINTAATSPTIYKNKVYDITASGSGGIVYGIYTGGGTTVNIYNNLVGDLKAPASSLTAPAPSIAGLYLSSGTTINAYYNTFHLAASSTGINFGTAAVYATTTPTTINLRNNIFSNISSPAGTGKTIGYQRASNSLTNYANTSNNNLFYGGAPGPNNLIYYDGTNSDQSIGTFKTRMATRDAASVAENPNYLSTVGANANFLHIDPSTATQIESGASPIATFTDDYDGEIRNISTPDIGADEFAGTPAVVVVINSVSITPTGNQCTPVSRTVTANITAGNSNLTSVTLNYTFNGISQPTVTMTGGNSNAGSTSTWTGTIPAGSSGVAVTWNVSATDALTTKATAGAGYTDDPLNGSTATAFVSSNNICSGSATNLSATLTKTGTLTLGAGGTTGSSYDALFYHLYGGLKSQFLVKASELTALGLSAGNISVLGINMNSVTSFAYNSFAINIAPTALVNLTTTLVSTGFTQVYANASYTPTTGINSFVFGTGAGSSATFNWDGTSNIVIQFCWSNNTTGGTSNYARIDATSFTSCAYYRADSQTPAVLCPQTTGSGTTTNRPQFIFTGNTGVVPTSVSWSDGTSTIGTGNPLTVNPTVTTTYTGTVTALGCTKTTSNSVTVTTIPLPAAPSTGPGNPQCGTGTPSVFASSPGIGDGNYRWYLTQTGGTALLSTTGTPTLEVNQTLVNYPITVTTTFYVSVTNGTCESSRTPVTAVVNQPDPIQAVVNNNNPCANTAISLSVQQTGTSNNYTYTWTASPVNGSGIPTSVNGSPVSVTPTIANTYIYSVTAVDAALGCTTGSTVSVTVKALPIIASSTANPTTICAGANVTLSATTNAIGAGTRTLGNGTTSNTNITTIGTLYGIYYGNGHTQILYTAAELTAAGLYAGNVTSLGVVISALGSAPVSVDGFTIKMAHTSATSLSAFLSPAFTTVYGPVNYNPVVGTNTHNFSTPFTWDGTSNVVVDYCFARGAVAGTSSNTCFNTYTVTSFNSFINYQADATGGAACTTTTVSNTSANRPNLIWGGQVFATGAGTLNWVWNPGALNGATVTVNPLITTNYTVTGTDPATTCSNTANVLVTVNPIPPQPTGTPSGQCGTRIPDVSVSSNSGVGSPTFNWYTVATGGSAVQTGTSTTYLSNVSATTTFYVSEISSFGCESSREEVTVTVQSPDALAVTASPVTVCLGQSTSISSSYTPDFNNFATFDLTATGGAASGVTGTISLTPNETGTGSNGYSVTPTAVGTYTYTITAYDPDKGCTAVNSVTVTVGALPVISSATATPSTICAGATVTLNGVGTPQYTNVPVTGYNIDVVANGTGAVSASTTGTFDNSQYALAASDWNFSGSCAALSFYMPNSGTVNANSTVAPGLVYQLQPYTSNNDLRIPATGSVTTGTGTLTLTTPVTASKLFLLYGAGNGPITSGVTVTVTFTDATTQVFSNLTAADWFATTTPAISNLGRLDRTTTPACATTVTGGPQLFDLALTLLPANYAKLVQTIKIDKTITTGIMNVMAVGRLAAPSAGYNWVWNPGNLSGATVTVTPTVTTVYTATATDPATGCSANSSPVTVTVNPLPNAPATNDPVTRCGPGSVTLTATGAGGTLNWYNVASGGTSLNATGSYTTNVTGNTSFWVAETSASGCEGPRSQVHVNVTTPPTLAITPGGPTTFCQGGSVTLNGATASDPSYTNFSWSTSPATGAGLSSSTGAMITTAPTVAGAYTVTLNANDNGTNGCANVATIIVTANANPVITSATATPSTTCSGGTVNLVGTTSAIGAGFGSSIGTSTNLTSTTSQPTAFCNRWPSYRMQTIYTAAELSASGLSAGNITSMAFNISTQGDADYNNNFTVQVSNTALTALTAFLPTTSGFTTVFPAATFTHVTGQNIISFSTPFVWNGTSNIVVDVQMDGVDALYNSQTYYTTTSANTVAYTSTSAANAASLSTQRLNVIFGGQVLTNGPGNLNWVWNPGNLPGASVTVHPIMTTNYTVSATNPTTGCNTISAPVAVTIIPVGATATATPSAPVCAGTTVTLNSGATGGAPFTYSWSDGGATVYPATATITVNPTVTTTYTVDVADACGNHITSSVTVTVNPLPTASIQETGPITLCSPATQVLTAVTNTATPAFQWTLNGVNIPGATGSTYTVSGIRTGSVYRVIVTNTATSCVSATSQGVTITINPQPAAVTVTPPTATICNGGNVSLTSGGGITGGSGNAILGTATTLTSATAQPTAFCNRWSQYWNQTIYTAAELSAAGLQAGSNITSVTYTITTQGDANNNTNFRIRIGNTASSTLSAFQTTGFTTVFGPTSYTHAVGTNLITFTTPFTWNGTSNIILDVIQDGIDNINNSITYFTAAADNKNFEAHTSTTSATTPIESLVASSSVTGTASTTRLNVVLGYSSLQNPTFTWSPATGLNTTSGATVIASPSTTTTYTATATNSFGCTNSNTALVTVNPRPTGVISGGGTYCGGQGSTATALSIAVTGAGPWSGTLSDGTAFSGSTSPVSVTVTPSSTTTYTIATLNGAQCSSIAADLSGSATVTINPRPTGVISGSGTYCNGANTATALSIALTGVGPWSGTLSDGTAFSGSTSPISVSVTPSSTTTYTIATLNGAQCSSIAADLSGSATVTVNQRPTGIISGSGTYCNGANTATALSIAVTGAGPWSGTLSGGTTFSGSTSPISVTVTPSSTTTYTIATLNGAQCSSIAADLGGSATITINPRPTGVISGGGTYCGGQGSTVTALSIAVTGAGPWSGTLSDGTAFSGSTSPVSVTVTPSLTTTYTIATLNGAQCSSIAADLSGSATVTVNPTPATPTVTAGGPTTFCSAGGSVTLSSSSGASYQWNLNGSAIGGQTGQSIVVTSSGSYTVTVTNESNCSATSAATVVTVNPTPATPTVTANGPTSFCAGGSVTLSSSSATGNQWNLNGSAIGGQTGQSLVVTSSGDYTVTVTNGFSCSATSAITTVTVNPLAATPAATVTQPTCAVGTGTINVTSPLGAGNSYSIGGAYQSSPTFSGVAPGSYTLSVQNSFGCFAPATTTVTVNAQPFTPAAPVITGIVNVCPYIGTGTQITYHATATGNGTTTFNWVIPPTLVTIISGQGTADLTVTFQAGFAAQPNKQLRVTATNQCGTSAMTIYYLLAQLPTTPNAITGPVDACPLLGGPAQGTYTINKVVGATSYLWSSQSGTTTITHTNGTGVNDTTITVLFASGFTTSAITVQSVNECGTSSARSITVTRNAPSVPGPVSGPTNACAYIAPNGTAATYSVLPVAGVTYNWTIPVGSTGLTGQGTNSISFTYPAGYTGGSLSVIAITGCGASAPRTLTITTLNPATPSVIDVINTIGCPNRQYTYSLSAMPANATSVAWMVPVGATIVSGQGTTSITVSYPGTAVQGTVTAQAINNCGSSVVRSSAVKLPACAAGFAGKTESPVKSEPLTVQVVDMEVKVFPNPSVADFKLQVLTSGRDQIHVRVLDAAGRALRSFDVLPSEVISLGSELKAGAYLVEVRQGDKLKTTKILKF